MEKIKKMFKSAQSRYGTYSTMLIVVVIAIVIVANMVVGKLPERFRNIDLSSNRLYEITDQSRELLKNLDKEIQIHVLADKASADERIVTFIEKYASLSSKISLEWTDPVLHPTVLDKYEAEENTVVIVCPETERQAQVLFTDIITYDEMSYYYYGSYEESAFDAEGQLTGAVNKVISENTAKIYTTTGHGENALSASLAELMEKANFTVEELNTMMKEEIPEDCELLILNGPTTDLTGDEKTMISNYLQEGNDVILILGNGEKETPNLDLLMKEYGLEVAEGYIADTERCYQQNPYYIFPVLSVSGEMAEGIESQMVMMVNARGMQKVDPIRETITVEEFMTTSENGYAVTEEGESQGTYLLGAMATEEESTFAVISSYTMIDEYLTESLTTLENNTLFMNVVTSNFEEVTTIAIEAKSLAVEYNTMQYVGVSSLIVIFGIPLAILVLGFVRWLKRRKA